ncbi:MAG: DNA polymerase ligase N-terminal domain-containing protein [Woeseiaceae bacterium]|jgi:DNA ligase D-like protein (predicted 3'-phosphoesterase)|nr:DNA polymerase ligase N-terminal domain-containing protein [Woeseiaceae bacterium]
MSRFVIQKHAASSLHYDFRLEVDGNLKSWAVPKGLSTDPSDKRLAIRTDDHDLDYIDFEGVIPEGEYGAGTVIVWDRGDYRNLTQDAGVSVDIAEALANGHAVVHLDGEKLGGAYTLQRIRNGDQEQWLVIKVDDEQADARRNPVSTQPESVVSGKTIDQVGSKESGDDAA